MMTPVLSAIEQRAVDIIKERGHVTCAQLGDALWGESGRGGNSTCPWARSAGKVIKRLVECGVVQRVPDAYRAGGTLYELRKR
jgi:hypothetical protein